jgi:bilin biosynthesis protein
MESFDTLLAEIQRGCAWEHIPYPTITTLARVCGAAEVDRLIRELDTLHDDDLVDDAGDMGDEYRRLRTAYSQALAEVGDPAIDPLLQALTSANPKTVAYTARALGLIGTRRAFEPLVALLAQDRDDILRMLLLEALGRLRDERAVEILLPYLKPQQELNRGWMVRMAANALGRIGTEAVIQPLADVLATDLDWFARLGAVEGLRKVRHPAATEALRRAELDADHRVRHEAAKGSE